MRLRAELRCGVVLSGFLHPPVLPQGRHRAVPGLVGYSAVAGASEMCVSDEPGTEGMGRVGAGLDPGPCHRRLHEVVDGLGVEATAQLEMSTRFGPTAMARFGPTQGRGH